MRTRRRDGTFEPGPRARACYFCGADISHRRKDAWHCGPKVHPSGTSAYYRRKAAEAIKTRLVRRPRCMICDAPLDPKHGRGVTCSRACAVKRWNWFRRGKA